MEATELRVKTDELEKSIRLLVDEFISNVGNCSIEIVADNIFAQTEDGKKLIKVCVKVFVTV